MSNSTTTPRENTVFNTGFAPRQITAPHAGSAASFDYFHGDMLWFDSSVNYVKPMDTAAHAQYFAGVALRSAYLAPYYSMNLQGGPGAVKNYFDNALLGLEGVYTFYTTSGDTYNEGTALYSTATNAQTVTSQAGTYIVGYAKMQNGVTSVSGSSTTLLYVRVVPLWPVTAA